MDGSGSSIGDNHEAALEKGGYVPRESFFEFVIDEWDDILVASLEHLLVVGLSLLLAVILGVVLGIITYRSRSGSTVATSVTGAFLTVPSFALLGLLIAPFGLGYKPTVVALTLYALLPIVRNTIAGLRSVDPGVLEAAAGVGMGRMGRLVRVELPLAWPVILTGIRVSAQLILGIAAIAAYVEGPGLGELIFSGLSTFGSVNSVNLALAGTLGVLVLALLIDLAFILVRWATIPEVRRA